MAGRQGGGGLRGRGCERLASRPGPVDAALASHPQRRALAAGIGPRAARSRGSSHGFSRAGRRNCRLCPWPGVRGPVRLCRPLEASHLKRESTFDNLPISERSTPEHCGISVVDLAIGREVGRLEFQSGIDEIFDVQALSQVRPIPGSMARIRRTTESHPSGSSPSPSTFEHDYSGVEVRRALGLAFIVRDSVDCQSRRTTNFYGSMLEFPG